MMDADGVSTAPNAAAWRAFVVIDERTLGLGRNDGAGCRGARLAGGWLVLEVYA